MASHCSRADYLFAFSIFARLKNLHIGQEKGTFGRCLKKTFDRNMAHLPGSNMAGMAVNFWKWLVWLDITGDG